jgi:hypothetical protein
MGLGMRDKGRWRLRDDGHSLGMKEWGKESMLSYEAF